MSESFFSLFDVFFGIENNINFQLALEIKLQTRLKLQ